jgi:hypothetical protein
MDEYNILRLTTERASKFEALSVVPFFLVFRQRLLPFLQTY